MKKLLIVMLTVFMALAMISCDANWSNWPWTYKEPTELTYDDYKTITAINYVTRFAGPSGYGLRIPEEKGDVVTDLSEVVIAQDGLYSFVNHLVCSFGETSIAKDVKLDIKAFDEVEWNAWTDEKYKLAVTGKITSNYTDDENYSVTAENVTVKGTILYEDFYCEDQEAPIDLTFSYKCKFTESETGYALNFDNVVVNGIAFESISVVGGETEDGDFSSTVTYGVRSCVVKGGVM